MMGGSSRKPTGMKGKVHDLATTLQMQNEELSIEKGVALALFQCFTWPGHVHSIKANNSDSSGGMQGQLNAAWSFTHGPGCATRTSSDSSPQMCRG